MVRPQDHLTCLVPTHNRPQFLRRLFEFYSQFPPTFSFMVIDSSSSAAATENLAVIESRRSIVNIAYRHFDLSFVDKCVLGLEQVRSPYVVFCGDDDLLFPDAVWSCLELLQRAPEYSAAMGRTVQLNTAPAPWHGNGLRVLKGYSIEHERPLDRCRQMAKHLFSSFYAVYRTDTLLDNYRITAANSNSQVSLLASEMLLSQLSVLRGRLTVQPVMYSIRQRHKTNAGFSVRTGLQPDSERIYQQFKHGLVDQFVRAGIDQLTADQFIDDKFGYLRDPQYGTRRRRRSKLEVVRQSLIGMGERVVDHFRTDQTRHGRWLQASDVAGCELAWSAAVRLIREFPQGMPVEQSALKRCA